MTDNQPLGPTDAELWQLHMQMPGQHKDPIDFASAALASHGQAPDGAGEPTEQQILEAAFAPAQPAAEQSRFGSPELQAMIVARCVEKDQADSVLEDAAQRKSHAD